MNAFSVQLLDKALAAALDRKLAKQTKKATAAKKAALGQAQQQRDGR
jgi:hypothetical protein